MSYLFKVFKQGKNSFRDINLQYIETEGMCVIAICALFELIYIYKKPSL